MKGIVMTRVVATIIIFLFGIAMGSAIRPQAEVRDPLATVVSAARIPLAEVRETSRALVAAGAPDSVPTIRAETTTLAALNTSVASNVTAEAQSLARLATAVISPTPTATPLATAAPAGPAPTQANVAGSGATLVPTARSGEVEVVLWGGPFDGWLPVIIVNGTDQPVVIEQVEVRLGGRAGIGSNFAPALVPPGGRSIGTLVWMGGGDADLQASDFVIITEAPTDRDRSETFQIVDQPLLTAAGDQVSFGVRRATGGTRPAMAFKGVCFDDAGAIVGLFWIDPLRQGIGSGVTRVQGDLIGPGPCVDPLVGVGS